MNADLSTGTLIVSIVAMLGWLVLILPEMRSFRLGKGKMVQMALAWIAIFALVAFAASRFGG
jgi:hypothetical protein